MQFFHIEWFDGVGSGITILRARSIAAARAAFLRKHETNTIRHIQVAF